MIQAWCSSDILFAIGSSLVVRGSPSKLPAPPQGRSVTKVSLW